MYATDGQTDGKNNAYFPFPTGGGIITESKWSTFTLRFAVVLASDGEDVRSPDSDTEISSSK